MPEQLMLTFTTQVSQTRHPDGSVTIKPGPIVRVNLDITVSQAARRTGIPRRTIVQLIHDKVIPAWRPHERRGGKWKIPAHALDELRRAHPNMAVA